MIEEERRVAGLSAKRLLARKCLVDEHAFRTERRDEVRKQRPMQVVHRDDHVEARHTHLGVSGFQIHDLSIDRDSPPPRLSIDELHGVGITIDSTDGEAMSGEPERMTAVTARDIERQTGAR